MKGMDFDEIFSLLNLSTCLDFIEVFWFKTLKLNFVQNSFGRLILELVKTSIGELEYEGLNKNDFIKIINDLREKINDYKDQINHLRDKNDNLRNQLLVVQVSSTRPSQFSSTSSFFQESIDDQKDNQEKN